ncbi:hypothetical protein H2203_005748 [Taxawa tesnikishii (nom. ined.)]|nr:hypothetical protein H2203_005748 [Dothideales sp. JES 119]
MDGTDNIGPVTDPRTTSFEPDPTGYVHLGRHSLFTPSEKRLFRVPRPNLGLDLGCADGTSTSNENPALCTTNSVYYPKDDLNSWELDALAAELPEDPNDQPEYAYELRPGFRNASGDRMFSTWIDKDESGNYDPAEERRRTVRKRKTGGDSIIDLRKHLFAKGSSGDEGGLEGGRPKRHKHASLLARRQAGASFVVTLPMRSDKARNLLRWMPDNWPEGHRNTLETGIGCEDHEIDWPIDSLYGSSSEREYKLRSRRSQKQERPDLSGHPAARGCWGCAELSIRCSLLDNELSWPCQTCAEGDVDCELVVPAERKRTCENCKRRRLACSYVGLPDCSMPCIDCDEAGLHCIAGPVKDSIRVRAPYGRDWSSFKYKPRRVKALAKVPTSCRQCTLANRRCSLADGTGDPPCTSCDMLDQFCSLTEDAAQEMVPPNRSKHQHSREKVVDPASSGFGSHRFSSNGKGVISANESEDEIQEQGEKKKIMTKLCHPIRFNHDDPTGLEKCHFCSVPAYRILGMGARCVEVISFPDSNSYTETSGGHLGEGADPTRVCMQCTMTHIRQLVCRVHVVEPIPNAGGMDFAAAFTRLMDGKSEPNDLWCSICPAPALYRCVKTQSGMEEDEGGCGVLFCETCAVELVEEHQGDLHRMLEELEDRKTDARPFGLTADVELLRSDGVLIKFVKLRLTA